MKQDKSLPINARLLPWIIRDILIAYHEHHLPIEDIAELFRRSPTSVRYILSLVNPQGDSDDDSDHRSQPR